MNRESAEITIIDVRQLRVLRSVPTPPGPVRVCRDAERLLVALYHGCGLLMVDLNDPAKQQVVPLPAKAISVGYHAPSRIALLSCHDQRVYLVDTVAGAVIRSISTRSDPDPMAVRVPGYVTCEPGYVSATIKKGGSIMKPRWVSGVASAAFVTLFLLCQLGWSAAEAQVIQMRVALHIDEKHPVYLGAKQMAARVEERTKGQVKMTLYPNNALGSPPEMAEQVALGTLDMSLNTQGQLENHVKASAVAQTPLHL